jgi:MOB kinase activator 1
MPSHVSWPKVCPIQTVKESLTRRYEYHWCDGVMFKKPVKISAPEYVDYLMTWVQNQLDDETVFPSKIGMHINYFPFYLSSRLNTRLYHIKNLYRFFLRRISA